MPLNFRWVGLISSIMPEARIINVRRDPIATCWSNYKTRFFGGGNRFAYNLDDLASYYRLYSDLIIDFKMQYPGRLYELNYEELVTDPRRITADLLNYLGLRWEESCLTFFKNRRVVKTASNLQVRQPIYNGSSLAWKNYEKFLGPLTAAFAVD